MCYRGQRVRVSVVKIDPSKLHSIGRSVVGPTGNQGVEGLQGAGSAAGPSAAAGADRLALSQRAEEIKAARAALAETPDVRAERVAALKAQVEAGTYQVDPDKVAERILNPRI